jgi:hypothetical protein
MKLTIKAAGLRVGDELADGDFVLEKYNDGPDGIWLATGPGEITEEGYVDHDATFHVLWGDG